MDKKLEDKKLDEITVEDMMLTPMGCKIVAESVLKFLLNKLANGLRSIQKSVRIFRLM